jgi:hypothetical protein
MVAKTLLAKKRISTRLFLKGKQYQNTIVHWSHKRSSHHWIKGVNTCMYLDNLRNTIPSRVYPISATKGRTGQFCGSNPMNQPSHNRNLSGAFVLLVNIVGVRVLFELLLYRLVYLCVCTLSNQNRTFILIFHPICVLLCPRLLTAGTFEP